MKKPMKDIFQCVCAALDDADLIEMLKAATAEAKIRAKKIESQKQN